MDWEGVCVLCLGCGVVDFAAACDSAHAVITLLRPCDPLMRLITVTAVCDPHAVDNSVAAACDPLMRLITLLRLFVVCPCGHYLDDTFSLSLYLGSPAEAFAAFKS